MRVYVSRKIDADALELLGQHCDVKVNQSSTPPDREFWLQNIDQYDGILSMLSDKLDEEVLTKANKLKVISNYAVGTNNIDADFAKKNNILIGHTPDLLTEATAELALCLLLSLSRNILSSNTSIKEGLWSDWEPMGHLGLDLHNKTLGIVGMGRIGGAFAEKCQKLYNMKVLYTKRTKIQINNYTQVELSKLLSDSDIISVHCPLTEKTKNLFNKEAFNQMRTGSVFINTARGEIHNEQDLLEALESKKLWGVGLDVTNPEPMSKDSKLLNHPRAVVTPHIGSATENTRKEMALLAAHNILHALKNQKEKGVYLNIE